QDSITFRASPGRRRSGPDHQPAHNTVDQPRQRNIRREEYHRARDARQSELAALTARFAALERDEWELRSALDAAAVEREGWLKAEVAYLKQLRGIFEVAVILLPWIIELERAVFSSTEQAPATDALATTNARTPAP
ncbi:hypothetical protein HK405_008198, partial [Cladochytrium tenue]